MPHVSHGVAPPPIPTTLDTALGFISQTYDRGLGTAQLTPASGTLRFTAMPLLAGQVVTNLIANVAVAGVAVTHAWLALYSTSLAQVGVTVDSPVTFQSLGIKAVALTSAFTVPANGVYYAAFLGIIGTTMPALQSVTAGADGRAFGANAIRQGQQAGLAAVPNPLVPDTSSTGTPWFAAS